ncbi:MAG TPA: hypothetical protein VJ063_14010 [Verrucomicrobiae bacterium]|nr:hypothetical protein [Verrucomicrobiae bacterium]
MPGTVNDFMERFAGAGSMDDREASHYYDRFASTHPDDRDFDNNTMSEGATQYLGQLPDHEFERAASTAFSRTPPQQQRGLLGTLLGGLQNRGVDLGSLGVGSSDPNAMGPNEYARLASYARRNHPDLIRDQVREQPGLLKAMGNPIVMGALGMVAAHMMRKRRPQFV